MTGHKHVTVALILLVAAWACASSPTAPKPHKQLRYLMGTLVEIAAYPSDETSIAAEKTEEAINAAFEELKRLDAMLSNWRADSELMQLNRSANSAGAPVKVSQELFDRLQKALLIAARTGGGFDPTVGPLVRAWGFLPTSGIPGDTQAVEDAGQRVGWKKIILDSESRSVKFRAPGMEVDLGGIAKGYAAQRALQILHDHGVTVGVVSMGSSSIAVLGDLPGSAASHHADPICPCWRFRVRDPGQPERAVAEVQLTSAEALATSGTYEKVVSGKGGRRSHIINPHTGEAITGEISVTVVAEDAETADALTKPFFFVHSLHSPEAQRILQNFPKASVMLIARQGQSLRIETAGAQPARFVSLLSNRGTATTYAAKTR